MLGIVILNYQSWQDTLQCIQSISDSTADGACQIYLVDNASPDQPEYDLNEVLEKYGVILLRNQKNIGYNAGNNVGIARALADGCDGILIANSDVFFRKGSIETMWSYLQQHPQAGIVGPKIYDIQGRLQKSNVCQRTNLKEKYLVRTRLHAIFRRGYSRYFGLNRDYEQIFPVYAVLGCCLMLSRACAEAVTPFDEYPFLYDEELMLGIRMEEAGYQTIYNPEAVIEHRHGGSTCHVKAFAYIQNIRSELYYCREYLHAKKWAVMPLYWYRTALYLARCIRYADFCSQWREYRRVTAEELKKYKIQDAGKKKEDLFCGK